MTKPMIYPTPTLRGSAPTFSSIFPLLGKDVHHRHVKIDP